MKVRCIFSTLFLFTGISTRLLWGQSAVPANPENDRMILAYSFYMKQKMSMDYVLEHFPSLKEYVENTMKEWNREFISSVNCIDSALTARLGDQWQKTKETTHEKYIRIDYSGTTEEQARKFVDVVNDRTYGRIESPIVETFLIWNPRYRKSPEKEFSDGYTMKFSTKEQKNPLLINIKIIYPRSWKAAAGNKKSNVVQTFISGYGLGNAIFTIYADKAKNDYTAEKISQLLSQDAVQRSLAGQDKVQSFKDGFAIDNCKAVVLSTYSERTLDNKKTCTLTDNYVFYYKNYRILLKFAVTSDNTNDVYYQFRKYEVLEKKLINNVVVLSQWGQ